MSRHRTARATNTSRIGPATRRAKAPLASGGGPPHRLRYSRSHSASRWLLACQFRLTADADARSLASKHARMRVVVSHGSAPKLARLCGGGGRGLAAASACRARAARACSALARRRCAAWRQEKRRAKKARFTAWGTRTSVNTTKPTCGNVGMVMTVAVPRRRQRRRRKPHIHNATHARTHTGTQTQTQTQTHNAHAVHSSYLEGLQRVKNKHASLVDHHHPKPLLHAHMAVLLRPHRIPFTARVPRYQCSIPPPPSSQAVCGVHRAWSTALQSL